MLAADQCIKGGDGSSGARSVDKVPVIKCSGREEGDVSL